ncbi:MAG: hypothetical protein GY861_25010 [bacterium]|nr:hypothetical protein [bacterium]
MKVRKGKLTTRRFTPVKINPQISAKRNGGIFHRTKKPSISGSISSENATEVEARQILVSSITNVLNAQLNKESNEELSLDETRALISYKIREKLEGKGKRVLLIMPPPGSGKTVITTKIVNRHLTPRNLKVAWFGSQHSQFDDFREIREDWTQIWGRNFDVEEEREESEARLKDNCVKASAAISLAKKGYDVTTTLCRTCPVARGGCLYYKQLESDGHRFFVHQHLFTPYWENADLVVIDEFSPELFLDSLAITWEQLCEMSRKTRSVLFKALGCLFHRGKEISGRKLYDALDEYVRKLRNKRGIEKTLLDVLDELEETLQGVNPKPTSFTNSELNKLLPKQLINDFPALLRKEVMKWQSGQDFNGQISVCPATYAGKSEVKVWSKKELPVELTRKPVIILTATGDSELIRKLLHAEKEDFEVFRPTVQMSDGVEIFQATGAMNGKVTMSKLAAKKRIVEQVKELWNDPETTSTCLISHKKYEKELAEELGLTLTIYKNEVTWKDTGHFWNIKGTNAFKDREQLVIIGNPTPNPAALVQQARALYSAETRLNERPDKEEKAYLCALPDGKEIGTEILTYQDTRIQRYLELLREGELIQSLHRIRPLQQNGRENIKIILLTAQQIDGLKVIPISFPTWHAKTKEGTIKKMIDAATLLLSTKTTFTLSELITNGLSESTVHNYAGEMQTRMNLQITEVTAEKTRNDGKKQTYKAKHYHY